MGARAGAGEQDGSTRRIVVGVDGSPASRRALGWAVDEARARGGRVEAVHAWHVPATAVAFGAVPPEGGDTDEARARRRLDEIVDGTPSSDLAGPIERVVTYGPAPLVLLEAAKGADLLVVGRRGLGGFAGLLLGSVSTHCAHHAPCPVLIVPPPDA
jgi:nucleotide-binding universal stress UspA family protein